MRRAALLTVPALLTLFAACDDGELGVLLPQVAIDACRGGTIDVAGETVGGVQDCGMDLGQVAFSTAHRFEVIVRNPSNVPLRVDEVSLTPDSDPAFFVEGFPSEVLAGAELPIVIWFQPVVAEQVTGGIVIRTDGSNMPAEGITIDLSGAGTEGNGSITVSPDTCDFGLKTPGTTSYCDVQLDALGASVAIYSSTVTGDPTFSIAGNAPTQIPDNAAVTLRVEFTPTDFVTYGGVLVLETSDAARPRIEIPLRGQGTNGPTCTVVIDTVNGAPAGPTPILEPLDDVRLRVDSSHPDAITIWTFLDQPAGSTAVFTDPVANETQLSFDGNIGIDVAGTYRVQAVQTVPNEGTTGSCELQFNAVPDDELLIQLSWDSPVGDLDLHVIQEDVQGRYCSRGVAPGAMTEDCGPAVVQDCYYSSCRPFSELRPDWDSDGVAGSGGDPSLDVDDLCGFGPENTNVDFPAAGRYLIGVDHFGFTGCAGTGSAIATVRIYSYGQLVAEHVKELNEGDFWEVAVVDWPGGVGNVCVDDLATPIDECGP
jgi:hypothetical protein